MKGKTTEELMKEVRREFTSKSNKADHKEPTLPRNAKPDNLPWDIEK